MSKQDLVGLITVMPFSQFSLKKLYGRFLLVPADLVCCMFLFKKVVRLCFVQELKGYKYLQVYNTFSTVPKWYQTGTLNRGTYRTVTFQYWYTPMLYTDTVLLHSCCFTSVLLYWTIAWLFYIILSYTLDTLHSGRRLQSIRAKTSCHKNSIFPMANGFINKTQDPQRSPYGHCTTCYINV